MRALFCLQLAALEVALRGARFYGADHPRALGHLVASASILYLAASIAETRAARAVIALLLAAAVVTQLAFFRYYHVPIDDQVALAASRSWMDVRPMLLRVLPALAGMSVVLGVLEYVWLSRLRRARPRRLLAAVALCVGVLIGGSLRRGTTEMRIADAAGSLAFGADRPPPPGRPDLGPVASRRARVPSVLIVLTESVRASDYCGDVSAPCPDAPEVAALLPHRVPLLEMRSVSAYTAISLSVLLTGRAQLGSRAPLVAAPDLFDYARATRAEGAPMGVHYWSAQSPTIFERTDLDRAVDSLVTADTLMGHPVEDIEDAIAAGFDRRLADECRARLPLLVGPYVVMVHFSGTHAPYFFDDASAPFTPFQRHVTWSGLDSLHRAYKNAIVEQDRSVAACVRAFVDAQQGGPHLVLFTSDHGEAFGEHGAIHHGQSLFDDQVHVPAFVVHGGGALEPAEERALASASGEFVTHYDVLPTLLDAMGVLDHFALGPARAQMPGRSLLRPPPAPLPVLPISNCSAMWTCPVNAWGLLQGDRKLTGRVYDGGWRCMTLQGGERELDLSRCADLIEASRGVFPLQPNGQVNE